MFKLMPEEFYSFNVVSEYLAAFLVGLVCFYLVSLWIQIRELPPGPIPLPLIGNVLVFAGGKKQSQVLLDLKKKYGGIFTLWLGHKPFVLISNWDLAKEALVVKKNDFLGRPKLRSINSLQKHAGTVIFETSMREWDVKRKVAAQAVRKFADSEKLAIIVKEATEDLVEIMLKHKGAPFEPAEYLHTVLCNIIANTAFGVGSLSREESNHLKHLFDEIHDLFGNTPGDVSPLLLLLYRKRDQALTNVMVQLGKFVKEKHELNKETYTDGEIRNFSDAILKSAIEAKEEDKDIVTDEVSRKLMGDLFVAGIDTTASALTWIVLLLCNHPDMQKKIRDEIEENIGNRMPLASDSKNCPFTCAFITETLRLRSPAPLGVSHVAVADTQLAGHKIRKGTLVQILLDQIHHDEDSWAQHEVFKPERFLNSDGSDVKKANGFIPFGEGKRICLGEKLARNDLFFLLANLVQKVELSKEVSSRDINTEPQNTMMFNLPESFKIVAKPRV